MSQNQDTWNPDEWEAALLARIGISVWQARKLIEENAFEFRYVDPDVHSAGRGLIFGSSRIHKKLFEWFDKELQKPGVPPAGWISPEELEARMSALTHAKPKKPASSPECPMSRYSPEDGNKGAKSYQARLEGASWADMGGKSFMMSAKKHAKTHNLPWPPNAPLPA
jgi:hypothetical protein